MKCKWAWATALALFFAIAQGSVTAAESGAEGTPQNLITMNFQDVDIAVLAKFISEITGKNFVIDESVRGKVTLISPTKVTPQQAYSIFQSVLQIKGFTTVQAGPVVKIVPSRVVRESAALTGSQEPGQSRGDEYVTRMVKLRNVEAASVLNVIQPMVSHDGLVAAYPEANTLIITDDAFNVERLLKILGALDVEGMQRDLVVIPLKLAFADDVAQKIGDIMGDHTTPGAPAQPRPGIGVSAPSAQGPSEGFKIVPDERTNSLIVLAGPVQMREIKDLIAKLDVHSPLTTARIHVYRLKNAQALEIVDVLNGLLGGGGGSGQLSPVTGRRSLGRGMSGGFGGGFGGLGGFGGGGLGGYGGYGSSFGGYGGGYGGGGYGGGGFGGGGFGGAVGRGSLRGASSTGGGTITAGGTSGAGGGKEVTNFESQVIVTADPATNALVISAAPQDYETLRSIIEQLDVPRRQVFVQAIIAEVSTNHERDLGINFLNVRDVNSTSSSLLPASSINFGQLQNAIGNPLGLTGLGLGLATGGTCNIPVTATTTTTGTTPAPTTVAVPCELALLTALQQDTHSNVLSAPTLLTSDNEEAQIVVGENVPFVSSAAANSALVGQIFNAVDRQNVGITLDIVPQVTEGDYIRMDVYEEVSSVVGGTQNSTLGPTTTIRAASTTVMVQDHRTTVIGGLLSDTTSTQAQGIPFFSTIPVLGNLFSNTSRTGDKTNLLVFLTPHVIRTRQDLRTLSLDEREKFLKSLGKKELHDMPMSQVRELYKPSFSIAVPPSAELGNEPSEQAPAAAGPQPSGEIAPPPPPTPLNTEEINPSSKSDEGSSGVASGSPANASVRAADASAEASAPATAPSSEGKSSSGGSASAVAATETGSPAGASDPPGAIKEDR